MFTRAKMSIKPLLVGLVQIIDQGTAPLSGTEHIKWSDVQKRPVETISNLKSKFRYLDFPFA